MDEIKEAFSRVKQDIDFLYSEISELKQSTFSITESLKSIQNSLEDLKLKDTQIQQTDKPTDRQTDNPITPTHNQQKVLSVPITSTDDVDFKPLKPEFLTLSIGNEGVPTDRQTDKQTNQQIHKSSYNQKNIEKTSIDNAIEVLDSLDNLKKEIRLKFKRLTDQEMTVFSLLYQLSEQQGFSDYKTLSSKLNLTESSIRDYIGRLIKKGIPVEKTKINNKMIQLSISENLKKIVTLPTIMQLRDL